MLNRAYLSLGSNINPEQNLPAAVRELQRFGEIMAVSQVWESSPIGDTDQPNFLNAATLLETSLSARDLRLDAIDRIETLLNRVRNPENKNAPRTIDIDIALFNRDVIQVEHRHIPDPELLVRSFMAVPLAELDADYVHPQTGQTLREIAEALSIEASMLKPRPDVRLFDTFV